MNSTIRLGFIAVLAACACTRAQAQATLAEYLAKGSHPHWVALNAGEVLADDPKGLADFQRKLVTVGSLNVVAPTTMVLVDDEPPAAVDSYAALAPEQLIYVLMGSLSDGQWNLIVGQGLAWGDLNFDQRPIFEALLPHPFIWGHYKLEDSDPPGEPYNMEQDRAMVEGAALKEVRVRLLRKLQIAARNKQGYPERIDLNKSEIGRETIKLVDTDEGDEGPRKAFGVPVERVVANQLKRGELDFESPVFSKAIQVKKHESLESVLTRIGAAIGLTIKADVRVAHLDMQINDQTASARDLLRAVALMTTGTYRRVGNTYVLTSDLSGLGTRAITYAAWSELNAHRIGTKIEHYQLKVPPARWARVDFDSDDPLRPSGALREAAMAHSDFAFAWNSEPLPISDLPASWRTKLIPKKQGDEGTTGLPDKVWVGSSFTYTFVLPDHRKLEPQWGQELHPLYPTPPSPTPATKPMNLPPQMGLSFAVSQQLPVEQCLELTRSAGAKELWLQTENPADVQKCVALAAPLGIQVTWAVRPWLLDPANPNDSELNIFGDNPAATIARLKKWQLLDFFGMLVMPMPRPAHTMPEGLAPLSIPDGVEKLVLVGNDTVGYSAIDQNIAEPYRAFLSGGYSLTEREQFLKAHGTDPIDLFPFEYPGTPYFQPFFPGNGTTDEQRADLSTLNSAWNKRRRDRMNDGLARLLANNHIPVWTQVQSQSGWTPELQNRVFVEQKSIGAEVRITMDSVAPGKPATLEHYDGKTRTILDFGEMAPEKVSELLHQLLKLSP